MTRYSNKELNEIIVMALRQSNANNTTRSILTNIIERVGQTSRGYHTTAWISNTRVVMVTTDRFKLYYALAGKYGLKVLYENKQYIIIQSPRYDCITNIDYQNSFADKALLGYDRLLHRLAHLSKLFANKRLEQTTLLKDLCDNIAILQGNKVEWAMVDLKKENIMNINGQYNAYDCLWGGNSSGVDYSTHAQDIM